MCNFQGVNQPEAKIDDLVAALKALSNCYAKNGHFWLETQNSGTRW